MKTAVFLAYMKEGGFTLDPDDADSMYIRYSDGTKETFRRENGPFPEVRVLLAPNEGDDENVVTICEGDE